MEYKTMSIDDLYTQANNLGVAWHSAEKLLECGDLSASERQAVKYMITYHKKKYISVMSEINRRESEDAS